MIVTIAGGHSYLGCPSCQQIGSLDRSRRTGDFIQRWAGICSRWRVLSFQGLASTLADEEFDLRISAYIDTALQGHGYWILPS